MPESLNAVRIGTRGSPLARWQAEWVASRLADEGAEVVLTPLATQGDQDWGAPIGAIGSQGVFTKEIQRAVLAGDVDLAVHSFKDLPTDLADGLEIAAVPERASTADVLVSRTVGRLGDLPQGAVVGTGSLRRRAQLWHVRPDLQMKDIRGNVETRLRKLDEGQYDALVLAQAGLVRLGLAENIAQVLPHTLMLPAVGQGALALEIRDGDARMRALLAPLDHAATHRAVLAERAMLAALRGGCLAPIAAWGRIETGGRLHLSGVVLSADGATRLVAHACSESDDAAELGQRVAADLIAQGAAELIQSARRVG